MADRPPFPGAIAATHLRVYDTEAPDGLAGGTPHLHTACTEAYFVVAGVGAVQTLTTGGYEEVPLEEVEAVWAHIAERDDWAPFNLHIERIEKARQALCLP